VPVDPGEHKVVASAPGRVSWEGVARIEPKPGVSYLTVGDLAAAPEPPPPPGPAPVASIDRGAASPPPNRDEEDRSSGLSTQKIIGLGVAGVGVVGLVVGTVFGFVAKSKYDSANSSDCNAQGVCNAHGLQTRVDALNASTVSTVAFVAGGVLVAGGTVLFFTAPSHPRTGVAVGPIIGSAGGGVRLEGAW
jgi:hypothetical protein